MALQNQTKQTENKEKSSCYSVRSFITTGWLFRVLEGSMQAIRRQKLIIIVT